MSSEGEQDINSQSELIEKKKNKKAKIKPPSEKPDPPSEKPKPPSKKPKPPSEKPKPPSKKPKPPSEKPEPPSEKPEPPSEKPEPPSEKPKPPSKKPEPPSEKPKSPSKKSKKSDKSKSPSKKTKKSEKSEKSEESEELKSPEEKKKPSKKKKSSSKKNKKSSEKDSTSSNEQIPLLPSSKDEEKSENHELHKLKTASSLTFDTSLYKNINDFQEIGKIGQGGYGDVKKYKNKQTGELYAFKFLTINADIESEQDEITIRLLRREIYISSLFNEPTLHPLYGIIDDIENGHFIIITPFYKKGDVAHMIALEKAKKAPANWDFTQKFIVMYGIASGMYILHKQDLIHRDLKPANILLTDELEPLITDFGMAKLVDQNNAMFQTMAAGTYIFAAPEIILGDADNVNYDGKLADVYSFGVLIYQLFTGITPFANIKSSLQLMRLIEKAERPEFPKDFNPLLKAFIEHCWDQKPDERPTFEQILQYIGDPKSIEAIGGIDLERFYKYQEKVVPDEKFLFDYDVEEEEEETEEEVNEKHHEEEEKEEIPEFDPNDFTIKPELIKDITDFEKIGPIGKGQFGVVNKYRDRETGELVAIKKVQSNLDDINLKREIWILSTFHHPSLQSLYGIIDDSEDNEFSMITPFYAKGDLSNLITLESKKKIPPEWDLTQKYIAVYGIAAGMYYLHKHNLIHRDLKPGNVLLNEIFEPIIADFGLSKLIDQNNTMFQTMATGTPVFMAPEVVTSQAEGDGVSYDGKAADVYSYGMLCYQLLTRVTPFGNVNSQFQIFKILSAKKRPAIPPDFNESLKQFIEKCWTQEPEDRPPFDKILETLGNLDFIESIGDIDIERLDSYQSKVVPYKFRTIKASPQKALKLESEDAPEEEEKQEIPEFDPDNYTINPDLLKDLSDFQKIKQIGKGQFGDVYLYKDNDTSQLVAIKEVKSNLEDINLKREVWILSTFTHPTLQSLYGLIDDSENNQFYMITPFYSKGDLINIINSENKHKSPQEWDLTQKYIVVYGIAAGLFFLHNHNLIHRDLKPDNVLLDEHFEPIITDFGCSKLIDQKNAMFQTAATGTPAYMAPEIVLSQAEGDDFAYDGKAADVYSYGMLCFQLLTGIQPFGNLKSQFQLINILQNEKRPEIPADFNEPLKQFIEKCWTQKPEERPPINAILETLSSFDFVESIGGIDLERLNEYQKKVVPHKYVTSKAAPQKPLREHRKRRERTINRKTIIKTPEEIIKGMADAGDRESQYRYGCLLRDGKGVPENQVEAAEYFKRSADQDYVDGIISYAKCLKEGIGVEKNEKEAYRLMESAAERDDSEVQYNLGLWYANDRPPQYALASSWLKKAADNSNPDPEAPAAYAQFLEKGKLGVIPPQNVIISYYKRSSDLGSPKGMYHMALLYHSGENPELPKDINQAIRLYGLSASKGIQDAIISLSYAYEEIKKYDEAFNNAKFYADQDNFYGYLRLYELYEKGIGVKKDEQKSKEYLEKACEKRFNKVQSHVASLFAHAKGVPPSVEKAVFWTTKAAENESLDGMTSLGEYYNEGYGVEKNRDKALEWAHKGAKEGDLSALRLLAKIYGKKKDSKNEIKYLTEAANKGDERSMIKLGEIYNKLFKYSDSLGWYREAAQNMNPVGCFNYGEELFTGNHVTKNVREGLKYLELSASLNYEKAIEMLHHIYNEGTADVPKDERKAAEYLLKLNQVRSASKKSRRRKSLASFPEIPV